jgi:hypothetical protein
MQPPEISRIYWNVLTSIPVVCGTIAVARALKYGAADIGIVFHKPLFQWAVAAFGLFLGTVAYVMFRPEPLNTDLSLQSTLLPALILMSTTGLAEELVFRGVIQRAANFLGFWACVYPAAIYAVLQIGAGSAVTAGFVLAVGVAFGMVVRRTKSIVGVSLGHGLLNVMLYLVIPHLF